MPEIVLAEVSFVNFAKIPAFSLKEGSRFPFFRIHASPFKVNFPYILLILSLFIFTS